jgi:glycosyltransferase involved in cell wall biosynthesis
MKLSFVVPVYNVEKYLERCILSLMDQDIPASDYEVCIVNDGTKDNSLEIARNLAGRYPNLRVVSQENRGLSGARNTGLKEISGKYVWFVDSDDAIQKNCLKGLLNHMEALELDTCHIGFTHYFNNGHQRPYIPLSHPKGPVVTGIEFFSEVDTVPTAWSFVHRTRFLVDNQLAFREGMVHEDEEFLPRMLFAAQRAGTYAHDLYAYFENATSIMGTRTLRSDLDKCKAMDSFRNFLERNPVPEGFRRKLQYRAFVLFQTVLHPKSFFRLSAKDRDRLINALKETAFYPVPPNPGYSAKFTVYRLLMNLHLGWYPYIRNWIG